MSAAPLRIAIVSPVWFPVPPSGYGGIEWIVSLLADGLVEAGHDVTLFASGDSKTKAKLAYVYEEAPSQWIGRSHWELRHALACYTGAFVAGAMITPTPDPFNQAIVAIPIYLLYEVGILFARFA